MTATVTDPQAATDIASPCTKVCKLDARGHYCLGCLRTRDEIAIWSTASDAQKRAILDRIALSSSPAADRMQ
jgi:predicted Fe-S protein YdhL (DUF1289 family)